VTWVDPGGTRTNPRVGGTLKAYRHPYGHTINGVGGSAGGSAGGTGHRG